MGWYGPKWPTSLPVLPAIIFTPLFEKSTKDKEWKPRVILSHVSLSSRKRRRGNFYPTLRRTGGVALFLTTAVSLSLFDFIPVPRYCARATLNGAQSFIYLFIIFLWYLRLRGMKCHVINHVCMTREAMTKRISPNVVEISLQKNNKKIGRVHEISSPGTSSDNSIMM